MDIFRCLRDQNFLPDCHMRKINARVQRAQLRRAHAVLVRDGKNVIAAFDRVRHGGGLFFFQRLRKRERIAQRFAVVGIQPVHIADFFGKADRGVGVFFLRGGQQPVKGGNRVGLVAHSAQEAAVDEHAASVGERNVAALQQLFAKRCAVLKVCQLHTAKPEGRHAVLQCCFGFFACT